MEEPLHIQHQHIKLKLVPWIYQEGHYGPCLYVTTHMAKLGEITGKTRVLFSELGEITGKTRVLYSEFGEIIGKTRVLPGGKCHLRLILSGGKGLGPILFFFSHVSTLTCLYDHVVINS